jgi:long-chain acyl-CoA synthetase
MLNLATLLEESARRYPQKVAVIFGDYRLTYAQINGAANQITNGLKQLGLQPGEKVALSCPNSPYFPIVYYAILKAGGVVVPLNVLFKRREVAYNLSDSEAKVYLCFQGTPELPMGAEGYAGFTEVDSCEHFFMITIDPVGPSPIEGTQSLAMLMMGQSPTCETVQTNPEDTGVILYTSGTTGKHKGAELSHFNMFLNAISSANLGNLSTNDIGLVVLPLFHSFGQTVQMNAGIYAGATAVLLPRFEARTTLSLMDQENVTAFSGVPTMYWAMLNADTSGIDLDKISRTLRICNSGGAALPVEVLKAFEKKYNVAILEGYGLSETSPVASFNHLDRERKPGSIGTPIWGVEMKVFNENEEEVAVGEPGEIVIRGHNVMKGYYKRPAANRDVLRNGWFHTGDVGKMDEEGYFYIVDRIKDMIIRGGFNVYPREIEEMLLTHPAISLAAVIGVPNEEHGEEIKAFVVLKADAEATEAEIIDWCKTNMAAYKYPRMIEFRANLPMNVTGKILKTELRATSQEKVPV